MLRTNPSSACCSKTTNIPIGSSVPIWPARPTKSIVEYDKRADVENLVGEAKREGLDMIPSAKFKNNYAFFQIVMLAYNIWRYLKMIAQQSMSEITRRPKGRRYERHRHQYRSDRALEAFFIAAKVVKDGNRDKVKYSIHDARTPEMLSFLNFLDKARSAPKPWHEAGVWTPRFAIQ